jgi:hypothetical protein
MLRARKRSAVVAWPGRAAVSGLAAAGMLVAGASPAAASPAVTPAPTAKVDCVTLNADGTCALAGTVYAIAQLGTTTYIGGSFTSVSGTPRSNVAAIKADGTLDPTWSPSTGGSDTSTGTVYALAVAADRSKVFLGGDFTTVGTTARRNLAAVTPDTGAVVQDWSTNTNNVVRALAADNADRLYVGGAFGRLGNQDIPKLGAVTQSSGAVEASFVAPRPAGTVRALTLSDDGSNLYAGGGFTSISGQSRPGAAELDASTGAVTDFAPTNGGVVISMDMTPSGRLFFGTTTNRTYAYEPAKNGVPEYARPVRTGGDVQAILATDDEVYIGGHFTNILEPVKVGRPGVASFETATGTPTAWNPRVSVTHFGVWAIGLTNTPLSPDATPALSIGGDFTKAGGLARRGYTRFNF